MGILDSIIGTNTTSATDAATAAQIPWLWNTTNNANGILKDAYGKARDDLTGYGDKALGAVGSGYDAAKGDLASYGAAAQDQLTKGVNAGVASTLAGNAGYQPYAKAGAGATGMLSNALGLGGQSGHDAALAAFHAGPGYEFQVDQATDAAARKAASLGIAGSGNTLDAITRLGSNLADQEYGNWLSNLSGLGNQGLQAAGGIAQNDRAAGGLQASGGAAGASLQQSLGSSLANADASKGTAMGSIYGNLGSALGGNDIGLGSAIAGNNMQTQQIASGMAMGNAQAQDNATNANNGILGKFLGGLAALPLGGPAAAAGAAGAASGGSLGGALFKKAFQL